jgi:MYXO-CTERM domain-containing protein
VDQAAQVIAAIALFALAGLLAVRSVRRRRSAPRLDGVDRLFRFQREHLEAKFVDLAQSSRRPSAPRSVNCDFQDDVTYVRNRRTGTIMALVAITVSVAGRRPRFGDALEEAMAARSLVPRHDTSQGEPVRSATAVFSFDGQRWTTDGSVILDLSPSDAVRCLSHDLQIVGKRETAHV